MNLRDAYISTVQERRVACTVCLAVESLDGEDREFLLSLLSDRQYQSAFIARVCRAAGIMITDSSVKRHRKNH